MVTRRTGPPTSELEVFARGPADPARVAELVFDPRRLPEWTDVTAVEAPAGGVAEGERFTVVERGRRTTWRVVTRTASLFEVDTRLRWGALGVGVRVAAEPTGTLVVMAAAFLPASGMARARWLLAGAPAVRRRFDRWSVRAVGAGRPRGTSPRDPGV